MRHLWLATILMTPLACTDAGGSMGGAVDTDSGDPDRGPDRDPPPPPEPGDRTDGAEVDEILIAVEPRTRGPLIVLPSSTGGVEATITLALGDPYPSTFEADLLGDTYLGGCTATAGSVRFEPFDGASASANVTSIGNGFRVDALSPGSASFTVGGDYVPASEQCDPSAEPGTTPFELSLRVEVRDVAGSRIDPPCRQDVVQLGTSAFARPGAFDGWFQATLLDAMGEPFRADNAAPTRQVSVRLDGVFDAAHAHPEDLASWITPSRPGPVEIVPEGGAPLTVQIVAPSEITELDSRYELGGAAAGPTWVQDGDVRGPAYGRTGNRLAAVVTELRTATGSVCSAAGHDWFTLESLTPEVCAIIEMPTVYERVDEYSRFSDRTDFLFSGDTLGQAARVLVDGECELALRAPAFDPEVVLPAVRATFIEPQNMHEP